MQDAPSAQGTDGTDVFCREISLHPWKVDVVQITNSI